MSATNVICVHGIFRSGTNYARALFEMNFDCKVKYDVFGWKHGFFPSVSPQSGLQYPNVPSIVMTKNPFFALSSLQKYAATNDRNIASAASAGMAQFLRQPMEVFNANHAGPKYWFSSPIEFWNSMNWNLLSLLDYRSDAFHLRYEDLLVNAEVKVAAIAEKLGLERLGDGFQVPENRMRNLGTNFHKVDEFQTNMPFDSKKAQLASYMAGFSDADRAEILNRVSAPLVEKAGYRMADYV